MSPRAIAQIKLHGARIRPRTATRIHTCASGCDSSQPASEQARGQQKQQDVHAEHDDENDLDAKSPQLPRRMARKSANVAVVVMSIHGNQQNSFLER